MLHTTLRCHHQNDCCIKMGSNQGHFNVSLTVRDSKAQCVITSQALKHHTSQNKNKQTHTQTNKNLVAVSVSAVWASASQHRPLLLKRKESQRGIKQKTREVSK